MTENPEEKRKLCFQIILSMFILIIKYKICQDNLLNVHERSCFLSCIRVKHLVVG